MSAIVFREYAQRGYRGRTIENARADVTLAFAHDFHTAGENLTRSAVWSQHKMYVPVRFIGQLATDNAIDYAVEKFNATGLDRVRLNIAGNGIYTISKVRIVADKPDSHITQNDVDGYMFDFLTRLIERPDLKPTIVSVHSGGQTGFDEAGVKAAHWLKIPASVLAPKGWVFRDVSGKDIADEKQFKARFDQEWWQDSR